VLVFIGTAVLTIGPRQFALVNAIIVVVWLGIAWQVGREYGIRSETNQRTAHAV
jgi:hypothetical protein